MVPRNTVFVNILSRGSGIAQVRSVCVFVRLLVFGRKRALRSDRTSLAKTKRFTANTLYVEQLPNPGSLLLQLQPCSCSSAWSIPTVVVPGMIVCRCVVRPEYQV